MKLLHYISYRYMITGLAIHRSYTVIVIIM